MTYLVFNLAKFKLIKYFAIEIPCVFGFPHTNVFLIKKNNLKVTDHVYPLTQHVRLKLLIRSMNT